MTKFHSRLPLAAVLAAALAAGSGAQLINEVRIDQTGTDFDEYFELAGTPGASLDGLTYLVIGDNTAAQLSGVIESVTSLTGSVIPLSGYFVCAETTFTLGTPDLSAGAAGLNFENSDNVTHVLVSGFTGALTNDLDINDDGVLDVTPWTAVLDVVALIEENNPPTATEYHYGPPTVGPEGILVPGHAFRSPDGAGSLSSWNVGGFVLGTHDTPGAANAAPTISAAVGGRQTLVIDGGVGNAGNLYLILASVSGTAPGTPLGSGTLPLNFDLVTTISLNTANGPVFQNTFSVLDASGRNYAAIALPTLGAGSIGLTLNTAGAVIDAITIVDVLVTNACGVTITI